MGAEFDSFTIKAKTTSEVRRRFEVEQEQATYDDGHSYSGRINMATDIKFEDRVFNSRIEAEEYVSNTAEKWGPAIAVQYKDNNGNLTWFVGAWCSS
jgi:hypothetical protein